MKTFPLISIGAHLEDPLDGKRFEVVSFDFEEREYKLNTIPRGRTIVCSQQTVEERMDLLYDPEAGRIKSPEPEPKPLKWLSPNCEPQHETIATITMQRIQYHMGYKASRIEIERIQPMENRVNVWVDHASRSMVLAWEATILGNRMKGTTEHPASWWQHFKQRWFPNWLLKRFPVEYLTHEREFDILFPNFKPDLPNAEFVRIPVNR